MIAAFLKNVDGDFDYPAAMFSLFLIFCISGMIIGLYRAFHTGRILFSWTPRTARTIEFYVEREKNPSGFWLMVIVYCLCILLFIFFTIGICFGFFRKSAGWFRAAASAIWISGLMRGEADVVEPRGVRHGIVVRGDGEAGEQIFVQRIGHAAGGFPRFTVAGRKTES